VRATRVSSDELAEDPELEQMRAPALAAARTAATQAQHRHERAHAAMSDPPKPPPSPLSDEIMEDMPDGDAELPPDEQLTEGDLQDITGSVGGASDEDKAHAKKVADMTIAEQKTLAMQAYEATVKATPGGPWPQWNRLGEFEWAAWRYFVVNGGTPPALTKNPRKVQHAMGSNG
jgi:hypothetical protein